MSDIKLYYRKNDYSRQRVHDRSNDILPYQKKIITQLMGCSEKTILDVGCGCAPISSLLTKCNKVVGIDLSESALREASQNGVSCIAASIEERLPFRSETFDSVLLTEVIEHIFDPVSLLKEIHRVLKDEGIIVCSVPNSSFILNRLSFLFTGLINDCTAQDRLVGNIPNINEHIRIVPPKLLKRLLIDSGFSISKIDYWFPDRFIRSPFCRLNFIARVIKNLRLHKIFPNLISLNVCMEAMKIT